ncbi:MAG: hypothetical protein ACRDNO_29940, partial [Trebonia sp.]
MPLPAPAPVAGVLALAEPAGADDAGAVAEAEAAAVPPPVAGEVLCPPADWSVPVPHPAATSEAAARTKNRVRMPCRRRNRTCGCAP